MARLQLFVSSISFRQDLGFTYRIHILVTSSRWVVQQPQTGHPLGTLGFGKSKKEKEKAKKNQNQNQKRNR